MNVYLLNQDHRYQGLVPPHDPDIVDVFRRFNGTAMGDDRIRMTLEIDEDDPDALPLGDFGMPSSHIPVFSRRAIGSLGPLLIPNGEILPISSECGEYFAFNVTSLIDALDVKTSR